MITTIIKCELDEIERREHVRIIYAAESGSRAWGFASPDSDYDVRFVYVRDKRDYLRLDGGRDVIEWKLDETLDINGWDVKKTLELAHASNITPFEWGASPIVYRTSADWDRLKAAIAGYYDAKPAAYHYYALAKKAYKTYLCEDNVRLKKYFYALRSILSCRWILENMSPPPIVFDELKTRYLSGETLEAVNALVKIKTSADEAKVAPPIPALQNYIVNSLEELEAKIELLPRRAYLDWSALNDCFFSMLD